MSRIFGPVIQQGYVVPNMREATKHWIEIGIGPFYVDEHLKLPGLYFGKQYEFELSPAFTYSGDQQIELIQPHGDAPSIYKDYLKRVPEGGLQHIAVWAEEPDDVVKTLKAEGRRFEVTQSYIDITRTNRNRHVYLDSIDHPGTMVQLMMHDPLYIKLFGMIKHAADTWDGSDPIRPIGVLLEGLLAGTGADWKHGDGD
jgi:hypothetical protein